MSRGLIAAISVLALAASPARAQPAEAELRFTEAEKLLAAGKVAEACATFEASNRAEPRAGTLINIGLCKEKLGRIASAWTAYRSALERVKDPKKKQLATERAAALEPRLSYLTIALAPGALAPGAQLAGLVIARDGEQLDAAALGRAIPIDGGSYAITATAPNHEPYTTTVVVAPERQRAEVTVPKLAELRVAVARPEPSPEEPVLRMHPRSPPFFTPRRKIAVVLGLVGVGALGAGGALGVSARALEDDAFALCPDPGASCSDAARANDLLDRGNRRALFANVAYAAGGAAVIGAIVLMIRGGSPSDDWIAVTPSAGGPGLDVRVRF